MSSKRILRSSLWILFLIASSCKKLVEIPPPTATITTEQTFQDSSNANSALAGLYSNMFNNTGNMGFATGYLSVYSGSSSDELLPFNGFGQISANTLTGASGEPYGLFWHPAYTYIYQTNAIIEGVQAVTGISESAKKNFIAESKFFRAFCYFYLINLFGDVPLITSTDYKLSALASRETTEKIYALIMEDLTAAQSILNDDYSNSPNERVRATKWAATTLLARVYLYLKDWPNAETQASLVISQQGLFNLEPDLNNVFSTTSREAIFQWQTNPSLNNGIYNATPEGFALVPYDNTSPPNFYINPLLLNAFETNDQRKVNWIDSTNFAGVVYYYPYKYKTGPAQVSANGTVSEYYTIFRLAELYLIRAEARAEQSNLVDAASDIDMLRARAGISGISNTPIAADQASLLAAIMQERRIELFAEWAHRWLDLKRTGTVDQVMTIATPLKGAGSTWESKQQLYPIPQNDRAVDPNLTQNPGY